jgi:lipopolysaccharide export LptBFGC system permease protein LptF
MARNEQDNRNDERENPLGQSLVLFVVFMVLFLGGIFALSFLTLDNAWPAAIALALVFLAFFVPISVIGRSDSSK